MHGKSELNSSENFRCCICFHVRTGTIIIGIWHLVLHILALTLLFSVLVHPEARNRFTVWVSSQELNGPLTSEYYSPQLPDISAGPAANYAFGRDQHRLKDVHVALAIIICTGVLTLCLLYGTIRGKPNCLMPFFSLQMFDFIVCALMAIGYFSSIPDVHHMLEGASNLPFQKEILHLNPELLCAILMTAFVVCMMLKAYFMGVVWSCYKYLKLQHVTIILGTYIEADNEALLPPDYDTATKTPPLYAPPPYVAGM